MKKSKGIAVVIIILLAIIGIQFFILTNSRIYTLELPKAEKIRSITISSGTVKDEVTDPDDIDDILFILGQNERKTRSESVNDSPVNIENPSELTFNFRQGGGSILYLYERENQYYLEQPYNGIYQISGDEYNSIIKYVLR